MIQLGPDILTSLREVGIAVTGFVVFGYLLIWLFLHKLKKVLNEHEIAIAQIAAMHKSVLDPSDPSEHKRVIPRAEIVSDIKQVQTTVDSRCGPASCPVVPVVEKKLIELEQRHVDLSSLVEKVLAQFVEDSKEFRREMLEHIDRVFTRINSIVDTVLGGWIDELRKIRKRNGIGSDKSDRSSS